MRLQVLWLLVWTIGRALFPSYLSAELKQIMAPKLASAVDQKLQVVTVSWAQQVVYSPVSGASALIPVDMGKWWYIGSGDDDNETELLLENADKSCRHSPHACGWWRAASCVCKHSTFPQWGQVGNNCAIHFDAIPQFTCCKSRRCWKLKMYSKLQKNRTIVRCIVAVQTSSNKIPAICFVSLVVSWQCSQAIRFQLSAL